MQYARPLFKIGNKSAPALAICSDPPDVAGNRTLNIVDNDPVHLVCKHAGRWGKLVDPLHRIKSYDEGTVKPAFATRLP
jgi:hypothetical protein